MGDNEYEATIAATRIGASVERFTPQFEVVSVSLALSEDGESEVLSLQRGFGSEAEEEEGVCLVFSPSQKCSYRPFEKLTLERNSLGMRFTAEAQRVFKGVLDASPIRSIGRSVPRAQREPEGRVPR